jgi:hypothetical protein
MQYWGADGCLLPGQGGEPGRHFGVQSVIVEEDRAHLGARTYPIVDDVIVVLDPARYPPRLHRVTGGGVGTKRHWPARRRTLLAASKHIESC